MLPYSFVCESRVKVVKVGWVLVESLESAHPEIQWYSIHDVDYSSYKKGAKFIQYEGPYSTDVYDISLLAL